MTFFFIRRVCIAATRVRSDSRVVNSAVDEAVAVDDEERCGISAGCSCVYAS